MESDTLEASDTLEVEYEAESDGVLLPVHSEEFQSDLAEYEASARIFSDWRLPPRLIGNQSIEKRKQYARDIYVNMPVVRFATIADKTGVTIDTIRRWREQGSWTEFRTARINAGLNHLVQRVGAIAQGRFEHIETLRSIQESVKKKLATPNLKMEDYKVATEILAKTQKEIEEHQKRLGITLSVKT